ncbi:MAG: AAA family ATPase, partial [Bacilli bacterium]
AKDKQLFNSLVSINKLVSPNDKICPVCNTEKENLKNIIEEKMKRLSSSKSELCDILADNSIKTEEGTVEAYISLCDKLKSNGDLLTAFALCGGSEEAYEKTTKAIEEKKALIKEKNNLLNEAKEHYLNVKKNEKQLKHDLMRYFKVEETNIIFNNDDFLVSITFPRKIETYSTGEINLIIFLYRIYSFLGSDKTTLVLDDPVSSLDLVNHYKIAYELVKTSTEKTIIILTHSAEFLNTVNSQYPSKFDFLYLEECSSRIRIQPIDISGEMDDPNIISLGRLAENSFVKALKEREIGDSSENIDVFHYTVEEKFLFNNPKEISNHRLIKMIDNFSCFSFSGFYGNTIIKIEYICALRVWVEYHLFKLITDKNKDKQDSFLKERDLNGKINIIFPRDGSNPFGITRFSRDDLMSKKVMLNQGVHYFSQVMPMAYAINISLDQLSEEIVELKNLFE